MKIKTSELTDQALDWAVAKAAGLTQGQIAVDAVTKGFYAPSANWAQAGPIIEREWGKADLGGLHSMDGHAPLIAAMRRYVASKLGDEVEIPEELV